MYVNVTLALDVHGLHEGLGITFAHLVDSTRLHAKEHDIVSLEVFLVDHIEETIGRIGLEGGTLGELKPQGLHG